MEGGRVDNVNEGGRVDGEWERVDKEGGRVERVCSNADSSSDSWFWFSTFFIPIFLSFFIYCGTEASMRISECKMQLTVELTSHSGQLLQLGIGWQGARVPLSCPVLSSTVLIETCFSVYN